MLFERSPKIYKRISQGLTVLAVACVLGAGLRAIKRNYDLTKKCAYLTVAASGLAFLSNTRYKRLENKFGEENNEN